MSVKEIILVIAAILFLFVAFYAIQKISKLPVSRQKRNVLYMVAIVIPILGLYLANRIDRQLRRH